MAKRKAVASDPEYQELAVQAVKDTEKIPNFSYSGDLPLGKTWAFVIGKHRDSGLLELSNYETVEKDLKERFPEDVEGVHSSHWAVGWVDELAVHMLDEKGKVTPAGVASIEWKEKLESYPVADEEDYNERQYEATIENIMSEGRIDRQMAEDVFGWLWDFDQDAIQDRDDQGGYPSKEQIENALNELGYEVDGETEEWKKPEPPFEHPGQLKLFGVGNARHRIVTARLTQEEMKRWFPRLSSLLDQGLIEVKDREYVGKDRDGIEISIGTVGYEMAAEDYLKHHPTPDTW